jgi:hypothetical protein
MTMTKTLDVFGVGVSLGAGAAVWEAVGEGVCDAAGAVVAAAGGETHDTARATMSVS